VACTSEITAALIMPARMARAKGNWPWLLRRAWLSEAVERLFYDQLATARHGTARHG